MDPQKLFRVMVVGGALLVGCREEELADAGGDLGPDSGSADEDVGAAPEDAGVTTDVAATEAGGEPINCGICPNTECCVTDASGAHERDGMMCCWGTSC